MDAGQHAAELARQHRPRLRKFLIAENLARDGLALDPLHDEAGAELVFGIEHMQHARRRQAGVMGELHQRCLGIEAGGARGRRAIARRRAAQDRADIAVWMDDIERPGLLAGAAGQFRSASDAGGARAPRGNASKKPGVDHLPLNFAGRFSRKRGDALLKIFRGARDAL